LLAREGVRVPVRCLGIADRIWDHGSQGSLRKQNGLSVEHLTETARSVLRVGTPAGVS